MPTNSLVAGNPTNAVFVVLRRHGFSCSASLSNEDMHADATEERLLSYILARPESKHCTRIISHRNYNEKSASGNSTNVIHSKTGRCALLCWSHACSQVFNAAHLQMSSSWVTGECSEFQGCRVICIPFLIPDQRLTATPAGQLFCNPPADVSTEAVPRPLKRF